MLVRSTPVRKQSTAPNRITNDVFPSHASISENHFVL